MLVVATRDNFMFANEKIDQGPIFSPTLYAHPTSGFMTSPAVGTSSPNKPAIVFRTISRSFIQSGGCPHKQSSGCASGAR